MTRFDPCEDEVKPGDESPLFDRPGRSDERRMRGREEICRRDGRETATGECRRRLGHLVGRGS